MNIRLNRNTKENNPEILFIQFTKIFRDRISLETQNRAQNIIRKSCRRARFRSVSHNKKTNKMSRENHLMPYLANLSLAKKTRMIKIRTKMSSLALVIVSKTKVDTFF